MLLLLSTFKVVKVLPFLLPSYCFVSMEKRQSARALQQRIQKDITILQVGLLSIGY